MTEPVPGSIAPGVPGSIPGSGVPRSGTGIGTIHDQGYRRYQGRRQPHGRIWWVIARAGIVERLRERRLLGLLLVAWLPFFVRAVQFYLFANFGAQMRAIEPTADTFREFLNQQGTFVFFLTIFIGAGLIANDRRANALQIYLSKPLTRLEYIVGKLTTLTVFLTAVTLVPALLLVLLQILFSGSTAFIAKNLFLIPAIVLFATTQVFVSGFSILALSSLSKSGRFVALMYAGILFFCAAMEEALRNITGSRWWAWVSPSDTMDVIAAALFRSGGQPSIPVWLAFVVVVVLIGVSVAVLERRVRGVEVVV